MIHSINAEHRDLIHDVAFDHYGKRMATCSSDQFVKVWDNESFSSDWRLTSSWKAHSGSVWKVTWAHPEFGQVLATCSFDRTVAVWEEIVSESNNPGVSGGRNWAKRTNLVDSRTSVTDVKFAPKSLGLMLATCSVDGVIRVYEAPDVMNLSQWTLQHEVGTKLQCSCISWNPAYSRERQSNNKIKIPANAERKELGCTPEDFDRSALKCVLPLERSDAYIVIPQVPMLAVGSDDVTVGGNKAVILQYHENSRRWAKVDNFSGVNDPVHDIAFAPRLGRSFDILALATKDVKIFTLTQIMDVVGALRYEILLATSFEDHNSSVWRVSWNVLGNIFASSGDDGCVRIWKSVYRRKATLQYDPHRTTLNHMSGKSMQSEDMEMEKPSSKVPIANEFSLHTLGLQTAWRCVATIKGDERLTMPSETAETIGSTPLHNVTTRYFKLASISHPSQVPWH